MNTPEVKERPILFFIGVLLLLLGLYGTLKTVVNLVVFDRYPQEGVYKLPFTQPEYYAPAQREQDCASNYAYMPQMYYDVNGTVRPATAAELESEVLYKAQQEVSEQNCVTGVEEARKMAMVNDISQSLIFLLLAVGILTFGRVFRKVFLNIKI